MVTTVTISATTVSATLSTAPAFIAIVALVVLLIQKEITVGLAEPRAKRFGDALTVAVVPLALVFLTIFALLMLDVLR